MSDRVISIGKPVYSNGRCEVTFELPPELRPFFRESRFWFECPDAGEVPESIAVIPAVANLVPLAWVFDCTVAVNALDQAYCDALPHIKEGYINMLPKLNLEGGLEVEQAVICKKDKTFGSPLQLFSGGVDAWCTLVRHIDELPRLVTVWGADVAVDNGRAWNAVYSYSKSVAADLGIPCSYVKSNLRCMYDYRALNEHLVKTGTSYEWWHDLQHGIGLLSLTAPLGYATGAPIVYIASTFYEGDKGKYTCASDPTIDNEFVAGSMRAVHDGYELTRQDKIKTIVGFSGKTEPSVSLRVCFHIQSGSNCCRCEKCGRTILGIYAAGGDPHEFGFSFSSLGLAVLSFRMRMLYRMKYAHYRYIQASAFECKNNVPPAFKWIYSDNLEGICDNGFKRAWERLHNFGAGLYHKLIGK